MFLGSRTLVVRVTIVLAGLGSASAANAEQRIFADLLTPSMIAEAKGASAVQSHRTKSKPQNGPVFFTINSVLAKMEGKAPPEPEVRVASLDSNRALALALRQGGSVTLRNHEPFNLMSFKAPDGALWTKWHAVNAQIESDAKALAACETRAPECSPAAKRFASIIADIAVQSGRARLEAANRLINGAIQYTSDLTQYGVLDRWSSPLETLGSGLGDCEDYAIAKYVALRQAGIAETDLRILLGRDNAARQDHAVLAARDGGNWLILDNRSANVRADTETAQFKPLFALDDSGVSLMASPLVSLRTLRGIADAAPASPGNQATSGEAADWGAISEPNEPISTELDRPYPM